MKQFEVDVTWEVKGKLIVPVQTEREARYQVLNYPPNPEVLHEMADGKVVTGSITITGIKEK